MNTKTVINPPQPSFNWEAVRQRIAAIKAELTMESEPPLEALERVWAKNAEQLAKPLVEAQEGQQVDLVSVKLGEDAYAVEADYVYDIRLAEQISFVPHVPDWVCGVYNLRGHILSVVDLSRFLSLPKNSREVENPGGSTLIVVKTADMECAFLVDQVLAIASPSVMQIQPPSELVRGLQPEYVDGIVELNSDEDHFTATILNIQEIMADERLVVNQEAI